MIWSMIVGLLIGAVAGAITNRGENMGCFFKMFAGLIGSTVGQSLLGYWVLLWLAWPWFLPLWERLSSLPSLNFSLEKTAKRLKNTTEILFS